MHRRCACRAAPVSRTHWRPAVSSTVTRWLPGDLQVGVWGRKCDVTAVLRDRDRVELYRPLTVDPKEARRLRYKRAKQAAPGKGAKAPR